MSDREGNLYVSDTFNNRVRKLTPQAEVIAPEPIIDVVVVNAASLQPGPVAPGEIVTIFAAGIGPEVGVGARWNGSGTLDTNLAETQVLFDGTPAALFYAQSGQVNAQVPYTVAGATIMESIYRSTRRLRLTLAVTPLPGYRHRPGVPALMPVPRAASGLASTTLPEATTD